MTKKIKTMIFPSNQKKEINWIDRIKILLIECHREEQQWNKSILMPNPKYSLMKSMLLTIRLDLQKKKYILIHLRWKRHTILRGEDFIEIIVITSIKALSPLRRYTIDIERKTIVSVYHRRNVLTIISNAAPIDKVDHWILLQMVYWYEPEKHEHREGSRKLLPLAAIREIR